MSRECGQGQYYQNLKGDQAMVNSGTAPTSMIFVLYGATGDLARRLVLPAFYRLAIAGLLPEDWRVIAEGRGEVGGRGSPTRNPAVATERA